MEGWAIECRINAEDPYMGFLPATGELTSVTTPKGPGVRVDTGVDAGAEITPYYDSMIAKLICYGKNRGEAILRMRRALQEYHILGVTTSIPFHLHMMENVPFMGGNFDTNFVVSPNPASTNSSVNVLGMKSGDYQIALYSMSGEMLKLEKATIDGDGYELRIGNLAQGVYLFRADSIDRSYTERIIVR